MDPVTNYLQAWSLISEAIGLNERKMLQMCQREDQQCKGPSCPYWDIDGCMANKKGEAN